MAFAPLPPPKSPLAYYRLLSPTAAVRVSPFCLGGMSFGDKWKDTMGACDKETTFSILDEFYDAGGNFIDTSNNYQGEDSEKWIGEWMEKRGVRDQIVLATKFSSEFTGALAARENTAIKANYVGNSRKSLVLSVKESLKKLRTDYIDVLYIHWWDYTTSIPELMHSLHHLVAAGTVLYLGVSDTPAWVVAKANEYARAHSLTPFVVYQGLWNVARRDLEREVIPMCEAEGMGIAPWSSLGGGKFKPAEELARAAQDDGRKVDLGLHASSESQKVIAKLEEISKRRGVHMTALALAYVMAKYPYVYPIVGCRTLAHLKANINALKVEISKEEIKELESAGKFDAGFPHDVTFGFGGQDFEYSSDLGPADIPLTKMGGVLVVPEKVKAIKPPMDA